MIQNCGALTLMNIDARCETSFGGIKRVLVGAKDMFTANVSAVTEDGNSIDYITSITRADNNAVFVEFKFRRNTASYTSTVAPDVAIGNSFATTEVTLQFSKAEAYKRMAIQALINDGNAVIIIEDMYGQYLFLGYDREVVVTNATMVSGTSESDLNGFTLTLQDVSLKLPYFIAGSVDVNGLLTPINEPVDGDMTMLH